MTQTQFCMTLDNFVCTLFFVVALRINAADKIIFKIKHNFPKRFERHRSANATPFSLRLPSLRPACPSESSNLCYSFEICIKVIEHHCKHLKYKGEFHTGPDKTKT